MSTPIRVALADDQAILRGGLAALLAMETDLEVVGQAADCAATCDLVAADALRKSCPGGISCAPHPFCPAINRK